MKRVPNPYVFVLACAAFMGVVPGVYFAFGQEGQGNSNVIEKSSTARVIFAAPFTNETGQEQYEPTAAGMGDLLAVMGAGAYGYTMSSNYNSRPRASEVMVDGKKFFVAKKRETYKDLTKGELARG